jgi:methylmalonyl-CoA/ethylmalonyl-CoA epimerase
MILRVEHIGLAVKDLQAANKLYESLLGSIPYKDEHVPSEKVRTSFFKIGETKIELLRKEAREFTILLLKSMIFMWKWID